MILQVPEVQSFVSLLVSCVANLLLFGICLTEEVYIDHLFLIGLGYRFVMAGWVVSILLADFVVFIVLRYFL